MLRDRIRELRDEYSPIPNEFFSNVTAGAPDGAAKTGAGTRGSGAALDSHFQHHLSMVRALLPLLPPEERQRASEQVRTCCGTCQGNGGQCPPFGAENASSALRSVSEMVEAETRRIAHTLHDEAGQLLTVVHLKLADVAHQVPTGCRPCFEEIGHLLEQIEMQLRQLSHELRPTILDDLGLVPAIESLAKGVAGRTGMAVTVRASLEQRLAPQIETALYRTVQEALTNAGRHAHATGVDICLCREGNTVQCVVKDNGCGFDDASSTKGGLGLRGMQDRVEALAGWLLIVSHRGEGTELSIGIPAQ